MGPGIEPGRTREVREQNLEESQHTAATRQASDGVATATQRRPSVFLSYASEDRPAARLIRDTLVASGLDVWYDESELDGGDSWDQKIRRQIRECDYFMPMVSATTEARPEGYFRREWRLAVERTLDMADDHPFLLPVVIDNTSEAGARVPEKFLAVQWVRAAGGNTTPALEALCRRITSGKAQPPPSRKGSERLERAGAAPVPVRLPEFPREEPGQPVRFWFEILGWALRCGWISFRRLPRWVRYIAYAWLAVMLLSKGCSSSSERHPHSAKLSPEQAEKLNAISEQYRGSRNPADLARLGEQIASEVSGIAQKSTKGAAVLAIPFTTTGADPAAAQVADSTFAQLYGRISISHPGQVGLSAEPLPSLDSIAAQERGAKNHSTYVLTGGVGMQAPTPVLSIKIVEVSDGSVVWSKDYPTNAADPQKIAAEVDGKVNSLDDLD